LLSLVNGINACGVHMYVVPTLRMTSTTTSTSGGRSSSTTIWIDRLLVTLSVSFRKMSNSVGRMTSLLLAAVKS